MSHPGAGSIASHSSHTLHRLQKHDLEIGVNAAVQRHIHRNVVSPKPVSQRKLDFENARPRCFREMAAEALGVFLFVYPAIASQASFFTHDLDPRFGSIFQTGWAYAMGIAFAIIVCGSTSGGHFNPAITLCLAIWQGFPWRKVPRYIFAQIFGAFMAGLILVGQYRRQLDTLYTESLNKGLSPNSSGGPGNILCSFPSPDETNYGLLVSNEFFVDSFIGLVVWSVLDPANPFVTPASVPFIIGMAYATLGWGFANITISTNLARDLGTRIVAAIFYGADAFNDYSPIAIFVNIPATIFATAVYEILLRDSFLEIAKGHKDHEEGQEGLVQHMKKTGTISSRRTSSNPEIENFCGEGNHKRREDTSPV
ncbi:hypothetical protein HYALB_00004530 [Hymenoscyphus albidus]|uniref:Aquaporin-like protein n=1 Tax=Hymenoscyphus albidus TaxID=595503 RepID=A0A9N9M3D5_9HELO|nr:hypothetical protein HYALB_00004530 [Hymenoscyphus albidus]